MNTQLRKSLLVAACVMAATPAFSVPLVDGVMTPGEYGNSFTAGWYNDHNQAGSQFKPEDGFVTDVWYTSTPQSFYLYVEATLEAKNMIWGTGVTEAEALLYYQHWCSPNDGNPAALDGSNCAHHNKGFAEFKTDFKTMTDSEKVVFADGYKADLAGAAGSSLMGHALREYQDSVDYVIAALGCNTTDCDAYTTPMSFEFRFDAFTQTEIDSLIKSMKSEGLAFHLSPERGGPGPEPPPVPEPGTLALLSLGLVGLGASRKRHTTR